MAQGTESSYLYRNTVSYIGVYVSAIGVVLILFTSALDWILKGRSSYIGIFIYLVSLGIVVAYPQGECPSSSVIYSLLRLYSLLIGMFYLSRLREGVGSLYHVGMGISTGEH